MSSPFLRRAPAVGPDAADPPRTGTYLRVLTAAFTLFSSVRVVCYLPTIWAIVEHGDSAQHSLVTWLTWVGANATMAAWLYEHNGRRVDRAIVVNACNGTMCAVTCAVILWYRI